MTREQRRQKKQSKNVSWFFRSCADVAIWYKKDHPRLARWYKWARNIYTGVLATCGGIILFIFCSFFVGFFANCFLYKPMHTTGEYWQTFWLGSSIVASCAVVCCAVYFGCTKGLFPWFKHHLSRAEAQKE